MSQMSPFHIRAHGNAYLADAAEEARVRRKSQSGLPPGRAARVLIVAACHLLPATHSSRYLEEFSSELSELPRRHRLGHALRILRSAPSLRASIRSTPIAEREEP